MREIDPTVLETRGVCSMRHVLSASGNKGETEQNTHNETGTEMKGTEERKNKEAQAAL